MGAPNNGTYIVQGEISLIVTAMRRSSRWASHGHHQDEDGDPLLSSLSQLKVILNEISDLEEMEPNVFLSPFLEVIRSEDTTGPITGLALTSVNKFLSYGLIDSNHGGAAAAIENIADAVTHARFVGTDPGSDEVVLMKILHVLRTLILSPAGVLLTNESVCEIMQSGFRICFEMRLSELLRKSSEHTLMDMIQLLFSRLPNFKEDPKWSANVKRLKMRTGGVDPARMVRRKKSPKPKPKKSKQQSTTHSSNTTPAASPSTQATPDTQGSTEDMQRENVTSPLKEECDETSLGDKQPDDEGVEQGVAYIEAPRESMATTPVDGKGIIDITKGFQDASAMEESMVDQLSESQELPPHFGESQLDLQVGQLHRGNSNVDLNQSVSTEDLGEDSLVQSVSDLELSSSEGNQLGLPAEADKDRDASQPGESPQPDGDMKRDDFINPRGVRFIPNQNSREGSGPPVPYGLPCVRELFRFLISLTNPHDRHNTDVMIHLGLSLLTVALESGADHISQFSSLICLVKDDMCRYLFLLVQSERLTLAAASLRVCFLLFESMRGHLKLQLEMYLTRLCDMITSDHPLITYEMREIALESIVQLWRIPGLVTELFLNYDRDLYCSNLFEDLTKLLSKNAFPVSGLFSTHLLSLDALLTVVDSIEQHCHSRILSSTKPAVPMETDTTSNKEEPVKPQKTRENRKGPQIKPNRMKVTDKMPTVEELENIKLKKRVYNTGTELFNTKPTKGIQYLQEQGFLSTPLDTGEVITFVKENPRIDKKMLGEYITRRQNAIILEAFVKSFHFEDLRIDEALRIYLESFRLPGEAPVISLVMEHFADHWHKSNGEPFANADAAFTLSYAIIMLNVDQHNHNAKKQNIPMNLEDFKKNLKNINGNENFEPEMLEEIYNAIRNEEIVMPSEHTGIVRDNYQWKVLLKRGARKESVYSHAPTGAFDHELFTLTWGPTVAALSFVFDKSSDEAIIQKAISGFRKCAMISAHYGMSDVFDNLVISLCKFTTLLSSAETPEHLPVAFGSNMKAQLAARTVFRLAHRHGDILREGWKNILDCMFQLYRAKLLPKCMIEVEDFVKKKISLIKEEAAPSQRSDTGVFSSFYSIFSMAETGNTKGPTPEEQEATKLAQACIQDCSPEQLINDSSFLREESLHELVKALIFASQCEEAHLSMGTVYDEDGAVFFFEQLIKCVLQNRDRVGPVWQSVRDHIYNLVVNANVYSFMMERAVVGLVRLAIRLLRREETAAQVLTALRMLLLMKPKVIHSITQQISHGLHDLLLTNAANIHSSQDWYTLFVLMEVVGAGANPPPLLQVSSGVSLTEGLSDAGAQSDSEVPSSTTSVYADGSDRGYTSDSELYDTQSRNNRNNHPEFQVQPIPDNGSWMLVTDGGTAAYKRLPPVNQYSIELNEDCHFCDIKSLLKSAEILSFLVRDTAHITPLNFESCVHAIRAFAEACLNGVGNQRKHRSGNRPASNKEGRHRSYMKKSSSQLHNPAGKDKDEHGLDAELDSLSIQLLDLMHTLHTRASGIYTSWAEEGRNVGDSEGIDVGTSSLWIKCWCPLLQGIARQCCDARKQVRGQALTYLQRALLVHDLQTLCAVEWEACFNKILFPLLTKLLENIDQHDSSGMEETRMRASTLLCKVFLQHLSPLLSLSTFTALWLTILDFMDKYMHVDKDRSDLLTEAIPESLKNMLLVMDTAGIFQTGDCTESQLWKLTWDRIGTFLPHLKEELFKSHEPEPSTIAIERNDTDNSSPDTESAPLIQQQSTPTTPPPTRNITPSVNPSDKEVDVDGERQTEGTDKTTSPGGSPPSKEADLPTASSYFLHTPLPNVSSSISSSTSDSTIVTQSVPLLLDPELMKDGWKGTEPRQQQLDRQHIVLSSQPTTSGAAGYQANRTRIHDI